MSANSKNQIVWLKREENCKIMSQSLRRIMIITKEECHDWHYSLMSGEIASTTHAASLPHPLQNFFPEMEIVVNEDIQLNFLCCQQNAHTFI